MINKINKVASHLLEKFEVKTRSNGENFVTCHCQSHLKDFIREVHDGYLPDDFIHQIIYSCNYSVANNSQSICEVLEDIEPYPNIYDLTKWSISLPERFHSINDILSEYEGDNYIELLHIAQSRETESICEQTFCYLEMLSD